MPTTPDPASAIPYLLTTVKSHEACSTLPPSLSLQLTPSVLAQIARGRDAAQQLGEDGEEVYGVDLVCGAISASPLQLEPGYAVSPYRAGHIPVTDLAPGVALLTDLPPDEEAAGFWAGHRIDVRGVRLTSTDVRLFAWSGSGTVRMESPRINVFELIERLETASPLN